ncbi:MAG TPA: hypothetical protein VHW90_12845, partial [Stellaceae bacterium]|nr:hypothetical protein [Stellaceae bacterium]
MRMPMKFAAFCLCLFVLSLAACTGDLLGEDVIAQANQGGQVSFDVVKIDDAVLHTVLAQRRPAFDERFKKYLPPADLKIAIGDTVSVVIWESASDGLFGESLAQFSFPAGSLAKMATGQAPATSSGLATPPGMTDSTDVLDLLLGGGSAAQNAAADQTTLGANPPTSIVAGTHAISGYDVLQQAAAGGAGAGVNVV